MATVPAGALRQRASRVRSRSRSSSDVEPSQFSSVNVREAFTEASWLSSWAISLSGHGTAPSWRLGVYDLEVISAHIVDLETAQLLYPGTSEHAKADQVGQRGVLAFLRKLQQLSYLRGRESLPDRPAVGPLRRSPWGRRLQHDHRQSRLSDALLFVLLPRSPSVTSRPPAAFGAAHREAGQPG